LAPLVPRGLAWDALHDATLVSIECQWAEGTTTLRLRVAGAPQARIVATGTVRIDCPRMLPWGHSVSINGVTGPLASAGSKLARLEVEMQSGDLIVIEAESFDLLPS